MLHTLTSLYHVPCSVLHPPAPPSPIELIKGNFIASFTLTLNILFSFLRMVEKGASNGRPSTECAAHTAATHARKVISLCANVFNHHGSRSTTQTPNKSLRCVSPTRKERERSNEPLEYMPGQRIPNVTRIAISSYSCVLFLLYLMLFLCIILVFEIWYMSFLPILAYWLENSN